MKGFLAILGVLLSGSACAQDGNPNVRFELEGAGENDVQWSLGASENNPFEPIGAGQRLDITLDAGHFTVCAETAHQTVCQDFHIPHATMEMRLQLHLNPAKL